MGHELGSVEAQSIEKSVYWDWAEGTIFYAHQTIYLTSYLIWNVAGLELWVVGLVVLDFSNCPGGVILWEVSSDRVME